MCQWISEGLCEQGKEVIVCQWTSEGLCEQGKEVIGYL